MDSTKSNLRMRPALLFGLLLLVCVAVAPAIAQAVEEARSEGSADAGPGLSESSPDSGGSVVGTQPPSDVVEDSVLKELEELKKKLAEVERERNEAQSQAARSIEEKAAAEKRASEAMEMAAKHEQELKEAKDAEARQQEAFNSKQDELQKALEEQKSASAAIKSDADKAGLTLQQAQKELEGKMKRLEADLDAARHDDKEDEQKIAKLEEQLKGYTEKLDREKEAMKTVVKLRQEKEEMRLELERARDNIIYRAKTEWLPRAQESFNDLTVLAGGHLSTAAGHAQEGLNTAAKTMEQLAQQVDSHPHVESCRRTTRPYLDAAFDQAKQVFAQIIVRTRYPLPVLKDAVVAIVGKMGSYSQFKAEAGEATDYWLLHLPIILSILLFSSVWLSKGLRWFCLRSQQSMLALWAIIGLIGWLYNSDGLDLIAADVSRASLTFLHLSCILSYAVTACAYCLCVVVGPGRFIAVLQLACTSWVGYCYWTQLLIPVLSLGHAEGVSFTKAHLLRSIVCIALASLSLESTAQRGGLKRKAVSHFGGTPQARAPAQHQQHQQQQQQQAPPQRQQQPAAQPAAQPQFQPYGYHGNLHDYQPGTQMRPGTVPGPSSYQRPPPAARNDQWYED